MEDEQAVNLHVPGVSPGADEAQMTDQALQGPSDASRAAAPASPAPKRCGKTLIGVFIGASYFLVYFWRTPIFMLPLDILRQEVTTLFGRALDLQSCFSMAYILGFGCAKVPAVRFMSSGFFFRHRLAVHAALLCGSMLTECLGILIFSFSPKLQVLCVFVSCFFSSWIFGGFLTYLEGRQNTETLLAVLAAFYICAGNLSRGTAKFVVTLGVPGLWMPLAIGVVALPISLVFLVLADRSPGPSPEDIAMRSKRKAMSLQEQRVFAWTWMAGLVLMLLAYTLLTTVRSFRDFYSQQIFKSSLRIPSDRDVPSYVFFLVDLPGGVLSCLVVALFKRIVDNRRGLLACIIVITASAVLAVGSTIGFRNGILRGMTFQVLLGVGIYVAYSVIGSPLNERWLAATKTEGTLSFLVFTSDFCGYVGTIVLLLYRSFGPMSGSADADVLALFLTVEWWCMAAVAMAMAGLLTYFMWRLPKYDTRMPVPDQTTAEQSPPGA